MVATTPAAKPSAATAVIGQRHFARLFQKCSKLADMTCSRGSAAASMGVVASVCGTDSTGERLETFSAGVAPNAARPTCGPLLIVFALTPHDPEVQR